MPAIAIEIRPDASPIGMANPRPWALVATAVLMSVVCWRVTWSPTVTSRPRPDTIPRVTVSVYVPSGLPIAIAVSPTWIRVESPILAAESPVASTLIRARSLSDRILTMVAGNVRPSSSWTDRVVLLSTTWRFVRM